MARKFVAEELNRRFGGDIKFVRGVLEGPKQVGAILPTSKTAARRMASIIEPASGLPVLELGPGTGAITKAILERIPAQKLTCVEYSDDFFQHLRTAFPGVNFIRGDAFDLDNTLGPLAGEQFDCVISAVPLLNFPLKQRVDLINDILSRVPRGRPFLQISYGARPPVDPEAGDFIVKRYDFVLRNVPPAQLWAYSLPPQ